MVSFNFNFNENDNDNEKDANVFGEALKAAYPDMPGDIAPLAEALYK